MKTELFLDHQTILANQARPIHFAVRFQADKSEANARPAGAFCVVLDRSGSMEGEPLAHAREATKTAIKNLRPEDQFSLVVFDDTARVIVSLQPAVNRSKWGQAVDHIVTGGSTNLTGGWMLGREELAKVPAGLNRRLLLLTDGQLNVGIVDPVEVQGIVASGRERDGVRTACLGFGEDYDENLLGSLARCSNGELYDAESSETFPAIFARELEGLQALTVQNLRVRLKRLDFCENIFALNDYPFVKLPDGRIEVAIGDLVSEEERVVVFALEVLPLPTTAGQPVASLEGERLLEVEFVFDELTATDITSRVESRIVRVLATQNPEEVKANETVLSWVAVQRAATAVREATKRMNEGGPDAARSYLSQEMKFSYAEQSSEALGTLKEAYERLTTNESASRMSKSMSVLSFYASKPTSRRSKPQPPTTPIPPSVPRSPNQNS